MTTTYAGIGSRQTPPEILAKMTSMAEEAEKQGHILHSGGAKGADTAFSNGVKSIYNKRIFTVSSLDRCISKQLALDIAKIHHPAWDRCSDYARLLHARNALIVLGINLNQPVEYIICWTPGGATTGGTGTALRMARTYNIPIINLAISEKIIEKPF